MTTQTRNPLVTREALEAFTKRLVEQFSPEKVILAGSYGEGSTVYVAVVEDRLVLT